MTDTLKARTEFIELMGRSFQDDALSRIAGRIFGVLLFDGCAYSFGDLAKEIGVSRSSISTNTRALIKIGAINKTSVPADRQDYFIIHPNAFKNIIAGVIERAEKNAECISAIAENLPADLDAKKNMNDICDFYRKMAQKMNEID